MIKFKPGELVHVMYYQGNELPHSHEAIVGSKEPLSEGWTPIIFSDGVEGEAPSNLISFTPFDFINGGFTNERPARVPKEGDWGFFYFIDHGNEKPREFFYGELSMIGIDSFRPTGAGWFTYFSHDLPELAECVPNPFKQGNLTNQQDK